MSHVANRKSRSSSSGGSSSEDETDARNGSNIPCLDNMHTTVYEYNTVISEGLIQKRKQRSSLLPGGQNELIEVLATL